MEKTCCERYGYVRTPTIHHPISLGWPFSDIREATSASHRHGIFCGESFASDDVVYQCWVFPSWWVHFVKWTFPSCKKSERNFVSQAMNSDSPFFWPTSLNEMQFWFHRHVHRVPFNPKILLFFRSGRLWWWRRWFWDVQLEVSDMHQFCPNHDEMKSCEPVSITKYIYFVVSSHLKHMLVKLGHLSR